ncbi:MAG: pseudouridine synthase [archaeon]
MKIKLHQYLSKTGIFKSKKEALEAIKNGDIKIDDKVTKDPQFDFNKNKRKIFYKNKELNLPLKKIYIIMNKPVGYLSSKLTEKDIELGKKSVFSLINMDEKIKNTLFCVGRLDEDTSGLLIITNDGNLTHRLTNPNCNIKKTYKAALEKNISSDDIKRIENGIEIILEENGVFSKYKTKKCEVKLLPERKALITLTEGKKREVRRIFESIGNRVLALERKSIGNINLEKFNLKKGSYLLVEKLQVDEKCA